MRVGLRCTSNATVPESKLSVGSLPDLPEMANASIEVTGDEGAVSVHGQQRERAPRQQGGTASLVAGLERYNFGSPPIAPFLIGRLPVTHNDRILVSTAAYKTGAAPSN